MVVPFGNGQLGLGFCQLCLRIRDLQLTPLGVDHEQDGASLDGFAFFDPNFRDLTFDLSGDGCLSLGHELAGRPESIGDVP